MIRRILNLRTTPYFVLIGVLFCTQLRSIIILFLPFVLIFVPNLFKIRINKTTTALFTLIILSSIVGLLNNHIDLANCVLYIWLSFPLLLLTFGDVTTSRIGIDKWQFFFDSVVWVLIIVDFLSFTRMVLFVSGVDEMGWAYGSHFKGVSGLCMVNGICFLYYFSKFIKKNYNRSDIYKSVILFTSFVLCFSALTLITLFVTIAIGLFCFAKRSLLIKVAPLIIVSFIILAYSAYDEIEYNMHNIELFMDSDVAANNARKRVMYTNFYELQKEEPALLTTVGCGPAGFNSRTTFLINDDADNVFTFFLGHHMPYYHKKYIYPLWNKSFVSVDQFTDGARNKPFSSLIGFWAELGALFFFIFTVGWFKRVFNYSKKTKYDYNYLFLFFVNIFVYLLMITEYWFESSEYLLFILLNNALLAHLKRNDFYISEKI